VHPCIRCLSHEYQEKFYYKSIAEPSAKVLVGNKQSRSSRLGPPLSVPQADLRVHAASRGAARQRAAEVRRHRHRECTRACTGRPGRREGEFSVSRSIWDKVRRFRARRDTESARALHFHFARSSPFAFAFANCNSGDVRRFGVAIFHARRALADFRGRRGATRVLREISIRSRVSAIERINSLVDRRSRGDR